MTVIELSWLRPTLAHMSAPQLAHLQITQLTKSFGRGDRAKRALSNISLTVQGGEMVALLGASGSGKSTLLRSISGLHLADAGTQSRVAIRGEVLGARTALPKDTPDSAQNCHHLSTVQPRQSPLGPDQRLRGSTLEGSLLAQSAWSVPPRRQASGRGCTHPGRHR